MSSTPDNNSETGHQTFFYTFLLLYPVSDHPLLTVVGLTGGLTIPAQREGSEVTVGCHGAFLSLEDLITSGLSQ